jgi:hypothetical protein
MRSKLAVCLAASVVAVAVAVAMAMALAGCSASPGPEGAHGTALGGSPGLQITQVAPTGRIMNFGGLLYDLDGTAIRVLRVRLISQSGPGIRHVAIWALAPSLDEGGSFILQGDLSRCGSGDLGHGAVPVTGIVEPPHGNSDWRLVVSLVFTKPGRYHLDRLKIDYVEAGRRYWDYVKADIIVRAVSPKTYPGLIQPPC